MYIDPTNTNTNTQKTINTNVIQLQCNHNTDRKQACEPRSYAAFHIKWNKRSKYN